MPGKIDGVGGQELDDAQPSGESRSKRVSQFVSVLCIFFVLLVVSPPFAAIANQSFLVHCLDAINQKLILR